MPACNPSPWEVEAGGSGAEAQPSSATVNSKPAWPQEILELRKELVSGSRLKHRHKGRSENDVELEHIKVILWAGSQSPELSISALGMLRQVDCYEFKLASRQTWTRVFETSHKSTKREKRKRMDFLETRFHVSQTCFQLVLYLWHWNLPSWLSLECWNYRFTGMCHWVCFYAVLGLEPQS